MPREFRLFLQDILEAIHNARTYVAGISLDAFLADRKTIDAVIRSLEVIGEATKNVPDEIRSKYPHVEWKRLAGLRDILIHKYFGLSLEVIWDIVQNRTVILQQQIEQVLREESPRANGNGVVKPS